jgi:ketosteroid isomerase-like protein
MTEHGDLVRAACAAWSSGDISIYWDFYDPEVVADAGASWPEATGPVVGPEAVMRNYASIQAAFDHSELIPEGMVEGDDVLVAALLWRGVARGGGREVEQRVYVAYRFREGRIWRQWWFTDVGAALDVVGLPRHAARELPLSEPRSGRACRARRSP